MCGRLKEEMFITITIIPMLIIIILLPLRLLIISHASQMEEHMGPQIVTMGASLRLL